MTEIGELHRLATDRLKKDWFGMSERVYAELRSVAVPTRAGWRESWQRGGIIDALYVRKAHLDLLPLPP